MFISLLGPGSSGLRQRRDLWIEVRNLRVLEVALVRGISRLEKSWRADGGIIRHTPWFSVPE